MIGEPALDQTIVIAAAPARVLKAFFDADALGAWWQVKRSVTTPRALGPSGTLAGCRRSSWCP